MDKTKKVFGNDISKFHYLSACLSKQRFILKFGDDTKEIYHLKASKNIVLGSTIGVKNLIRGEKALRLPSNAIIIGNIRMGFGHYRIAMAIASCANALGYRPYWLDLNSFQDTTGGKIIEHINKLYSLGSRISQRCSLFDKLFWEPGSRNMYKKITRNAIDQKNSELMTRAYNDIDKNTIFIATHPWPAQAAIHAKMKYVVNVVPDNYPITLNLAEGALHTVQTPFSYLGYKTLQGMVDKDYINPMPDNDIVYVGHYVDHDIVSNIDIDCQRRIKRVRNRYIKIAFCNWWCRCGYPTYDETC